MHRGEPDPPHDRARARSRRTTGSSSRSTTRTWSTCPRSSRAAPRRGIPAQQLTPEETLRLEPNLNPELKAAVRVPDATMDAMRMPLRFFATAQEERRRDLELRGRDGPDRAAGHGDRRRGARSRHGPRGADRRRHRRERDRPVVGAGRADGRRRRADPALARRDARRARTALQHGDEPAPQVGRRRHHRAAARALRGRHELVEGGGSRRPRRSRGPRAADDRGGIEADPRRARRRPSARRGRPPAR